ncbi:MAG: insulinase family protein [Deltaproteobacteria bacterium]|nr:insulinase family protein [Deltaproteobacteria bacterium]
MKKKTICEEIMPETFKTVLQGGLTLTVEVNHRNPVCSVYALVRAGSADEKLPGEYGISHFIEHMLFKGTEKRKTGEVAMEIESAGGNLNAWTSFDETVFHMTLPSDHVLTGIDVCCDSLFNSIFDPIELEREKEVILEEIRHGENSPGHLTSDNLFKVSYGDFPYGRPIIGNMKSVSEMTVEDLKKYHRKWYHPSNIQLVVVGDVDYQKIVKFLEGIIIPKKFSGKPPVRTSVECNRPDTGVIIKKTDFNQTYLNMAFPMKPFDMDKTPVMDLLSMILGEGESSILQRILKYEKNLVLDSYVWSFTPRLDGLFIAGALLEPENINDVISTVLEQIRSVGKITEEDLNKAKTTLKSEEISQMQTVGGIARKRVFFLSALGNYLGDKDYFKKIDSVTLDDLVTAAVELLKSPVYVSVTTGKNSKVSGKSIEKTLKGFLKKEIDIIIKKPEKEITRELDNGIKIVFLEDQSLPFVSMRAGYTGGLLVENSRLNGVSPLLSSLLVRGTLTKTGEEIYEQIESLGGTILGFSGRSSLGIRTDILSENWKVALKTMAECILLPSFDIDEFENEKDRLKFSLNAEKDRHNVQVSRLFEKAIYPSNHPYYLNINGTEKSIESITVRKLRDHFRNNYPISQMVWAGCGNVDAERFADAIEMSFRDQKFSQRKKSLRLDVEDNVNKRDVFLKKDLSQNHIIIGSLGVDIHSDDRFILDVMSRILSGQSGRLFLDLRDTQGLAYQVSSFSIEGLSRGFVGSYIVTRPQQTPEAVNGILKHYKMLREEKISSDELKRTVDYMIGTYKIALQKRSTIAASAFFGELYGIGYDSFRKLPERLERVTADDIKRVAEKYLSEDRLVTAIYGPGNK